MTSLRKTTHNTCNINLLCFYKVFNFLLTDYPTIRVQHRKEEFHTQMKYTIIKETIKNELGTYTSFGIENENGYKISDISTNMNEVKKLIRIINELQTPPNYLYYEIDKFFSDI